MGQNKPKRKASKLKATRRAEDNFIRVTSLHNRRLTAPNIIEQLNQCHEKKCVNIHCEEAKQCQKAPVGQHTQRLDNRVVE